MQSEHLHHLFTPVFDKDSKILILGTFPSVKSREEGFYYGHPRNRFWEVLSQVTGDEKPQTIDEKRSFLLRNHIAVWDVIESCTITGSSDSSIRDVVVNDLSKILDHAQIHTIYANGKKAQQLYLKYQKEMTGREIVVLPSTSPANAAWSLEKLIEEWKQIKKEPEP